MRIRARILALVATSAVLIALTAPAPTAASGGRVNPHWTYRLTAGKVLKYHYRYVSSAVSSTDPNSKMEQTVDADVQVWVKSVDKQSNAVLDIKAFDQKTGFTKSGDWTPIHAALLPEYEVTIDPSGYMTAGKIISADTSFFDARHMLGDEKVLERSLKQIIFRHGARDTFYDGYTWTDTIPRSAPTAPGGRPAPAPAVQSITHYSVSAGTESDPKVTWSLGVDGVTRGSVKGKPFTETTRGLYTFEEAGGMIAGYSSTVETVRGAETYKTTRELTFRY